MQQPLSNAIFVTIILATLLCGRLRAENSDECRCFSKGCSDSICQIEFPFGERYKPVQISPNPATLLKPLGRISNKEGAYWVLVYVAIVEGDPFVYDVICKGCEDSMIEWNLKKYLRRLRFEIPGEFQHADPLYKGIMTFWITPENQEAPLD